MTNVPCILQYTFYSLRDYAIVSLNGEYTMNNLLVTASRIAELLGFSPDNITNDDLDMCIALAIQYQGRI